MRSTRGYCTADTPLFCSSGRVLDICVHSSGLDTHVGSGAGARSELTEMMAGCPQKCSAVYSQVTAYEAPEAVGLPARSRRSIDSCNESQDG